MAKVYDNSISDEDIENAILWRYMDVAKFVAMLVDSTLFVSRADLLGDPFEGSIPGPEARARHKSKFDALVNATGLRRALMRGGETRYEWARTWLYVSCWHMNPYESAAMWKLYAQSGDALAIRVKLNSLITQLPDHYYGTERK